MGDDSRIDESDSVGWTEYTAGGHFGIHQVVAMARVIMDLKARVEELERWKAEYESFGTTKAGWPPAKGG